MAIHLPIKLTRSIKCNRCTMRYKVIYKECPHCKDVPDGNELNRIIESYHSKLNASSNLGLYFVLATFAIAAVMASFYF